MNPPREPSPADPAPGLPPDRAPATVGQLDEDALVRRLLPLMPVDARVIVGAGDDCAVLADPDPRPDAPPRWWLLKTDAVVEGLHFHPGEVPERVGWKAMARVLSDVAAMGGRPLAAVVTLGIDRQRPVAEVDGWYRGLGNAARQSGTVVVGGETVGCKDGAWLSVSLLGEVTPDHLLRRDGGRPGDLLYVTGRLGGSAAGRHLDFTPRLEQGQWLARHGGVRAMMDLSDGLARDLPRLAAASGCSFAIDPGQLPRHPSVDDAAALTDGEDYELLMAVDPTRADDLASAWADAFPELPLTQIGRLQPASQPPRGFELLDRPGANRGWDHLRQD